MAGLTEADFNAVWVDDNGRLYHLVMFSDQPTCTFEPIEIPDGDDPRLHRIGGVVGAPIFNGMRRLRSEDANPGELGYSLAHRPATWRATPPLPKLTDSVVTPLFPRPSADELADTLTRWRDLGFSDRAIAELLVTSADLAAVHTTHMRLWTPDT